MSLFSIYERTKSIIWFEFIKELNPIASYVKDSKVLVGKRRYIEFEYYDR